MTSLREAAKSVDAPATLSVLSDLFGFIGDGLPSEPTTTQKISVSLRRYAELLQGEHIHVNIVLLGVELFGAEQFGKIDYALVRLRDIYAAVNIGVGRVRFGGVSSSDSKGHHNVTTREEIEKISQIWQVDNDGIDVFIPFVMDVREGRDGVLLGLTPIPGPCRAKDSKFGNGSVLGLFGVETTGRTLAHELGHYLGLKDRNRYPSNLMCFSILADSDRDSVELWDQQAKKMKAHCMCKKG